MAELTGLARRIIERYILVEPLERALALSSKLFIALIPTTIPTSSLLGADTSFGDTLVERFSLTGAGQARFASCSHRQTRCAAASPPSGS